MYLRYNFCSSLLTSASLLLLSSCTTVVLSAESDCVKGIAVSADDGAFWPELFRLTSEYPVDPTLPNRDESAGPVDPEVLLAAGVGYRYLDPTGFDYPNRTKEIPWVPPANGTNDADLQEFRDEKDYQYADIIVVTEYASKFYVEHIHAGGDEVRYVIDGSGYFDIRDLNDEWVRIHATAGDFIIFPAGIEHRFAVDEKLYIQAMRLFPGSGDPDWSSVARSNIHGNNTARNEYVDKYLCGVDPDLDHVHTPDNDSSANDSHGILVGVMSMAAALTMLAW